MTPGIYQCFSMARIVHSSSAFVHANPGIYQASKVAAVLFAFSVIGLMIKDGEV